MIDAHVHVGVWDHPDFLGRGASIAELGAALGEAGMSGALVMPTDRCNNAELLDELAAAPASLGAIWFAPWLQPTRDDADWAQANIDRIAALKLHPSLSRVRVTDAAFDPALDVAEAHDKVVLVHCGRWQEMASYRFAIDAATLRPGLKFLLAHAGGDTPPLATAAAELVRERGLDNVWFDISGLREYWVIGRNIARIGADRYLLGSDYCLAHPAMYVAAVRGLKLSSADEERVLGGNARALLGRPLRES